MAENKELLAPCLHILIPADFFVSYVIRTATHLCDASTSLLGVYFRACIMCTSLNAPMGRSIPASLQTLFAGSKNTKRGPVRITLARAEQSR